MPNEHLDPAFTYRILYENTYIIHGCGCDSFLLMGDREAIMIDAGMNRRDVRAFVSTLTGLPVCRVINTHSHFDHTGGNGFFDEILITEAASRSAKNTISAGEASDFPMDYAFTFIKEGDRIDLGGRVLEIIELDCHSQGNIAILDHGMRLLFSGDEVESGQVLLNPGFGEKPGQKIARPPSTVQHFLRAVQKLKRYEGQFDFIMPAHNGAPIAPGYIDRYIALAEWVLAGNEGSTDCSSPTFRPDFSHYPGPEDNYRRAELNGAALVYCQDRIYD